jgi:preprotein translocase subunit YajC
MLSSLLVCLAQAGTAGSGPAGTGPAGAGQPPSLFEQLYTLAPILIIGVVAYLLMFRPMQREKKQREALLSQIKKNDEVLLTSGIYGTVIGVAEDKDEITVKIADNTRVRVVKSAIARNLTNEEALKAQQAAGKTTTDIKTPPSTDIKT